MASAGSEQINSSNIKSDSTPQKENTILNTGRKTPSRSHEEKLKIARERQNEERQKKIEELKAQAEAAQKYREQKEDERRRRIEELRSRENDKRHQVEERKRAIEEAEKERREYILRKNQVGGRTERDTRLETKKRNERGSIAFAFGSSTPRLLEPADFGTVSPSVYWGHRRSTSITNVAYTGASLSRRSFERELSDGAKKRATSAGGADRQDAHRRSKSTSMYEVFNWGHNDEPPKRYSLSVVGSEINIDGPPHPQLLPQNEYTNKVYSKEDNVDTHQIYRTVARRKTDLMPTIPSPRDSYFGSKSSLSNTPRTPGRALSMSRLDQLAQPIRRNGEHIRAIHEREKRFHQLELLHESEIMRFSGTEHARAIGYHCKSGSAPSMSRSMTHLATAGTKPKLGYRDMFPLRKTDACKSMTQLSNRKKPSAARHSNKYDKRDDYLFAGSRSGDVTPGGSMNASRPGSAMSTSTTMSTSGYLHRRSVPAARKPRPVSIAGTGVSLEEFRQKKELNKPPTPKTQSTPKRSSMSSSMSSSMTSSMTRVSSVERKSSVSKRDSTPQKSTTTPRGSLSKASSSDKLRERSRDLMSTSLISTTTKQQESARSKEEKNALNTVKTESTDVIESVATNSVETDDETAVINSSEEVHTVDTEIIDEKKDKGTEKEFKKADIKKNIQGISEIRENSSERQENEMTSSMMSRSKITTEEEAKAALAERRRLAREEAERQAELERQRVEAERQAELQRRAEEEERQRRFEEESLRMAEEQRRAEEERLQQAIEEARKREEQERLKREDEERQKVEREEAEKKAKEDAEKQRLEVAEKLKREEKEREERRKRVEAIMSRTRKVGAAATPNSTPTKENNDSSNVHENKEASVENSATITSPISNSDNQNHVQTAVSKDIDTKVENAVEIAISEQQSQFQPTATKECYEQSVVDKETALMNSFASMIIDENAKNLQNVKQTTTLAEVTNGKLAEHHTVVANGNGHFEINNKKDTNLLVDIPSTDHLINVSNESQQITNVVNFNNNNSLLETTATLVTADSHENKEISLL